MHRTLPRVFENLFPVSCLAQQKLRIGKIYHRTKPGSEGYFEVVKVPKLNRVAKVLYIAL